MLRTIGKAGIVVSALVMAAEGDKVMGFDIHQMVVPSGNGTAVVPLPHPYIGKLVDKVSDNVKLNGHGAATMGSLSKHDRPDHLQLPGTIKFNKQPNKEGEVTGGTGKKVKINGKEAAVVGSTVTTCNDIGAKDNSVILAPGASIPMPVIINPKNTEEYNREREAGEKKPEFTGARWGAAKAKEGEEIELSAQVKDIADGNMVTFQIWKEGQDYTTHIALRQIQGTIENGTAKVTWQCHAVDMVEDIPPAEDRRYYFTVHSAWCPPKASGLMTMELRRPEISNLQWQDQDGSGTDKGLVGEALKLSVSCNADMEEGAKIRFRVFEEGLSPYLAKPEYEVTVENHGGKAETEWTYHYQHDPEYPLTEKPKFFFVVNAWRCKEAQSEAVEMGMKIDIPVSFDDGECVGGLEYTLRSDTAESEKKAVTGKTGKIESASLIPGVYNIKIDWKNYAPPKENDTAIETGTIPEDCQVIQGRIKEDLEYTLQPEQKYVLIINRTIQNFSA